MWWRVVVARQRANTWPEGMGSGRLERGSQVGRSRVIRLAALGVLVLATLLAGCGLFAGTPTTTPPTPVPTATPTLDELAKTQAAQRVSTMSLDDKLAQMIIIQFYEPTYTAKQAAIVKP